MNEEVQKQDDEISLIDLFAVLWHRKVMIIVITMLAAIGVVTYSVVSIVLPPEKSPLPNQYTPQSLMLIENRSSGASSSLSSLGGLASLAGISLPVSANFSDLAIFLLGTNTFLDAVVDEFDLITRYEIEKSPKFTSRKRVEKSLKGAFNDKSGVLSISFTDTDPEFARDVVNFATTYLEQRFGELGLDKNIIEMENLEANIATTFEEITQLEDESRRLEQSVVSSSMYGGFPAITSEINRISMELGIRRQIYSQLKVQYEMLKVNMASEKPAFQILEMAEVPDMKSGPGRGMLCVIVVFAAGFFSVFLAFVLNAVANIKNDPEAMAKLRRNK